MIVHDGRRQTTTQAVSVATDTGFVGLGPVPPTAASQPCQCGDAVELGPGEAVTVAMQRHQQRPAHKAYRARQRRREDRAYRDATADAEAAAVRAGIVADLERAQDRLQRRLIADLQSAHSIAQRRLDALAERT